MKVTNNMEPDSMHPARSMAESRASKLRAILGSLLISGVFFSFSTQSAEKSDSKPSPPSDGASQGQARPADRGPGFDGPPPSNMDGPFNDFGGGPGRFRGPGGFGGMGGVRERTKLLAQFDKDGDGLLNAAERKAAREFAAQNRNERRGPRGPRAWGRNDNESAPAAGPRLTPKDVTSFSNALYDLTALRTLFLDFENADWEKELSDFYHTDVEVPARLTVDGKIYPDVGVSFRGASSFMMVREGRKRSLSLSLDAAHDEQRLGGYRSLHLLGSHTDPTYLRSVLFAQIAREYIPAPKANFVRVVINGESWGVFVNQQAYNKDFLKENFGTTKGARWKVPGSPRGNGGLAYLGEEVAPYKRLYELKSKEETNTWADLIRLCRVLNQTPAEQLESALAPLLDIDGALKFLALDNIFVNNDGYWTRASDYNLYQDPKGRYHLIPHDANETFRAPEGPGMGGPRGGGGRSVRGVELDPFAGSEDTGKALLNKLLAVPALRARYAGYVREIAEKWLDWNKLGPLAQKYQALIAEDVKTDTHKLDTYEAFTRGLTEDVQEEGFRGPQRSISLKRFVEERRAYLLNLSSLKQEQVSGSRKE